MHRSNDGGCDGAEDPGIDARDARPLWTFSTDAMLHVRGSTAQPAPAQATFDLWRIPGRKRLALGVGGLRLLTETSAQRLRVSLADDLVDGRAYAVTVPLGPGLRAHLDAFNALAQVFEGHAPVAARARPVTRAALLHLRALQALDGAQAGASHRDIAQALFGRDAVAHRWQADGELRAQVRHLLRRAEAYMDGGYPSLAGVSPKVVQPEVVQPAGDEAVR